MGDQVLIGGQNDCSLLKNKYCAQITSTQIYCKIVFRTFRLNDLTFGCLKGHCFGVSDIFIDEYHAIVPLGDVRAPGTEITNACCAKIL